MLTLLCTVLVIEIELDVSPEAVLLTAELAKVLLDAALTLLLTLPTLPTLLRIAVADAAAAMEARVPLSIGAPARGRSGRLASATAKARA